LQVQYAFLELPKLPKSKPETGAARWAWLFVNAPKLTEVPADLPPGPHRAALELANKATFTQEELDSYRKVFDEIQQVRELADAKWAEGKAEGFAEGKTAGFAEGETAGQARALLAILAARGVPVSKEARARIEACRDGTTLDQWIGRAATAKSAEEVVASSSE
jgi:flagellar biosynthesis/type III secretory pathway protein FliH